MFDLICSRSQGHPPWTLEALAAELCVSVRTAERDKQWLFDTGRLPLPLPQIGGRTAIAAAAAR